MTEFNKIINNICLNNNIKYELLSENYVYKLEKNNKVKYIYGFNFDYNTQGLSMVLNDKYACYEVLVSNKLPTIKHSLVMKNYNSEYIKEIFLKYNKQVVVKLNNGSCGEGVYYLDNLKSLYKLLDKLLENNYAISICPFINIKKEYRVIVLDNEIKLIYGKINPKVIGDGVTTVKELLIKFNKSYFQDKLDSSYDYILEKDKEYIYTFKFNLSQGSIIEEVDSKTKIKLESIAKKVSDKLKIKFASIDIIETFNNELLVLEINSGVMMNNFIKLHKDGESIAYNIYEEAINRIFEE